MQFRSRWVGLLVAGAAFAVHGSPHAQQKPSYLLQANLYSLDSGLDQPSPWKVRFGDQPASPSLRLELGFKPTRNAAFGDLRRGSLLKMQIDTSSQLSLRARGGRVTLLYQARW